MGIGLEALWPPFGLHVNCGPLELSAIRDEDLPELIDAATEVHGDSLRPFPRNWAQTPMAERARIIANKCWQQRATFTPDTWQLSLLVRYEGRVIGIQGAEATAFPAVRTPDTFSWLAQDAQGHGIGTLMRQTICVFLFDELDAVAITSGAYDDNPVSAAVSRKVGYVENGHRLQLRDGEAAPHTKFILYPDRLRRPPYPVSIQGAEMLRSYAGVARL